MGASSAIEIGWPTGLLGELDPIREEVLTAETISTEERISDLSTKLALVSKEPIVCLADMGVEATGLEAYGLEAPVPVSVASSFPPSRRKNHSD
ncbi:hypothetical protein Nepgr_020900 [Nepenthes gracilis]|uniref:Uncharacterized protein n=1 Tax=Nepenthes gracilis TaxID=150966 RepID=A0AAD3SXS0_NEPGR|nr:hypothetical protein Nepgr_020900 [Nepenthes gracilis]